MQIMNMAMEKFMLFVNDLVKKERGAVDIVAIVILIAVAVVVALIFKDQISDLVETLLDQIQGQAQNVWN